MTDQGRKPEILLSPLTIKSMELRNRIVLPPMTTMLAAADGEITDRYIDFYVARARGGTGLITAEAADVHPYTHNLSLGDRGFSAIYDDRFIPGLRRLTDAMHEAGAKTSLQLHHNGNAMIMLDPEQPPLSSSTVAHPGGSEPRALTREEIEELIEAFASAARRAAEAGFDAVDIHGGHGYLIAQFMSAYFNRRTDEYGGDLRGRMRFPTEVLRAVRKAVGEDFPIIFRFSGEERVPGGRDPEESAAIAPLLVEAGADCLSITTGMHFTLEYTVAPMGSPRGLNVDATAKVKAAVKAAVDVPVMAVGRLNDPELAESVLRDGKADLIGIGRGLIADPELPNKLAAGRPDKVRWCIACNQGCIGSMVLGGAFNCLVNTEAGREAEMAIAPAPVGRRVVVAGGGPAGMEAARVAALRGHEVTLYEKRERLGGQFYLAALPPRKGEIEPYLAYMEGALADAGVTVVKSEALTVEAVRKIQPDVLIVAAGSKPLVPDIPGIDSEHVVTAQAVVAGAAIVGERVLVAGGGQVGCETAELLDRQGKKVTIIEMRDELAADETMLPRAALLRGLEETNVEVRTSTELVEIALGGVDVEREGKRETVSPIDNVVLALGVVSVDDLASQLEGAVPEIHVIGDADTPSNAMAAILSGAELARQI